MPLTHRAESLHSWWSDSNPPGPTIPLHTLAKPLSAFLHRRQVSAIISQGRGVPISKENADALISYLEAKEIPTSTKDVILQHLQARAKWEAQAETMANKYSLTVLTRLLHSPEIEIVESICTLLGDLSTWKSINTEIVLQNPCSLLITLATPWQGTLLKQSIYALSCISSWEGGARALAEAKPQDLAVLLLETDDSDVLQWICRILGNMAGYGYVILTTDSDESIVYTRLESLVEHPEPSVPREAFYALSRIREATEAKEYIGSIIHQESIQFSSLNQVLQTPVMKILPEAEVEDIAEDELLESHRSYVFAVPTGFTIPQAPISRDGNYSNRTYYWV
ncbi:hypothetical protein B0H17DRAFT_1140085 [Mycena rosella]|uniref:Uncharacterized protein n=1 Tax=Mycena rosella TaxID=1033263 RepID=A0AAD7D2T6_MYCRO|nr:hypothetical protein B0H17DRAFT_1140085 [Mycena rosella]